MTKKEMTEIIKDLETRQHQDAHDIHFLKTANRAYQEEIERLKKKSNEYFFELEDMKKSKFKLPKMNWNYLNYIYLLPLAGVLVGCLGFMVYVEPGVAILFGSVLLMSGAIILANYGMDKLKEKGLL